jgi:hypothetical protein
VAKSERAKLEQFARDDPLWPGQLAMLAAIALNFALPERLTVGPTWVLPSIEGVVLLALVVATRLHPTRSPRRHALTVVLMLLVTGAYLGSEYLLVHYLLGGGKAGGRALILSGVVLWLTNVLLFAVWYWLLDRGGPLPSEHTDVRPDFQFPHMTDEVRGLYSDWSPNFVDYLYVALTNASAFSPTDTMPLSRWTKVTMGVQATAALVTVGVIFARAVNILA